MEKKTMFLVMLLISISFISVELNGQDIEWFGSQIYTIAPFHPSKDQNNNEWFDVRFDDKSWSPILKLPDKDWNCDNCDRFYRGYFKISPSNLDANDFYLNFSSDDGIWIYVNGVFLGHWGGELHKPGVVNHKPADVFVNVDPVYILDKLQTGNNLVAIHVSDCGANEFFDLNLYIRPKRK